MMLYKLIPPPSVKATIQLPASKSISNRALIINALGKGIYSPENLSDCDDTQVMIKALTEGHVCSNVRYRYWSMHCVSWEQK